MFNEVDIDKNGILDFDEFLTLIAKYRDGIETKIELREGFDAFDADNDDYISKSDLI